MQELKPTVLASDILYGGKIAFSLLKYGIYGLTDFFKGGVTHFMQRITFLIAQRESVKIRTIFHALFIVRESKSDGDKTEIIEREERITHKTETAYVELLSSVLPTYQKIINEINGVVNEKLKKSINEAYLISSEIVVLIEKNNE